MLILAKYHSIISFKLHRASGHLWSWSH